MVDHNLCNLLNPTVSFNKESAVINGWSQSLSSSGDHKPCIYRVLIYSNNGSSPRPALGDHVGPLNLLSRFDLFRLEHPLLFLVPRPFRCLHLHLRVSHGSTLLAIGFLSKVYPSTPSAFPILSWTSTLSNSILLLGLVMNMGMAMTKEDFSL